MLVLTKYALAIITGMLALILLFATITFLPPVPAARSTCGYCHPKEVPALAKSAHKDVSCLVCHKSPQESWLATQVRFSRMLATYATGSYRRPIEAAVTNEACEPCHRKQRTGTIGSQTIRVKHKEILENGSRCTDCHNAVAHGKSTTNPTYPDMDACSLCHNGETASEDCAACHTKTTGSLPTAKTGPWWVTHSEKWVRTHGMGDQRTCAVCHSSGFCGKCHSGVTLPHPDGYLLAHGKEAKENKAGCLTCHTEGFCYACHGIQMPHPAAFLPAHSKEARRLGLDTTCYRCHTADDCNLCHVAHTHPGKLREKSYVKPVGAR